nr:immunoglobulin light chain junction region [Macaca mulatta]
CAAWDDSLSGHIF